MRPTFLPAVPRLVAIGDLHGDMQKARRAFRLGGLVDAEDRWIGGTTTAVQVAVYTFRSDLLLPGPLIWPLLAPQQRAECATVLLHCTAAGKVRGRAGRCRIHESIRRTLCIA